MVSCRAVKLLVRVPCYLKSRREVRLGARIAAVNPDGDVHEFYSEPNELTWLKLSLTIEREGRSPVDVELLRPLEIVGHLAVGDHLPLEIDELNVRGFAVVMAIEACSPIAEGAGEVVTGRYITRQVDEIANVTLATGDQLCGTPIHPVWVINQQAFVPLGELTAGDLLDTNSGPVAVTDVEVVYRPQPVYNLEINAEHVYRVGELGVLVHNSNVPGDCTPLVEITIPPKVHGNTAGEQLAYLYERYDADGNFLKYGITQNLKTRYTRKQLNGGWLEEVTSGPRSEMLKMERDLVERTPGPLNREPWAGSRLGQ
jgi:Pretoxin HINT domain